MSWKKHQLQEDMMHRLSCMHKCFFHVFQTDGASFSPSPFGGPGPDRLEFACHFGKAFSTAQGLACHKRLQHNEFAAEHEFIKGTTCPICPKFFWTRERLYLHLANVPRGAGLNACFQELCRRKFNDESDANEAFQAKPVEVKGLARVETLQAEGSLQEHSDVRDTELHRDFEASD